MLQTEHLNDNRSELQVRPPSSHPPVPQFAKGHHIHYFVGAPDNSVRKLGQGISSPILQMRKRSSRNEDSVLSVLIPSAVLFYRAGCHFRKGTSRNTEIRREEEQAPWSTLLLRRARREAAWKQLITPCPSLGLQGWPTVRLCRSAGPGWRGSWG